MEKKDNDEYYGQCDICGKDIYGEHHEVCAKRGTNLKICYDCIPFKSGDKKIK